MTREVIDRGWQAARRRRQHPGRLPETLRGDIELAADGLSGIHRAAGTRFEVLEIAALDVSSSDIRRRLREGQSGDELGPALLPDAIREQVVQSGVYA